MDIKRINNKKIIILFSALILFLICLLFFMPNKKNLTDVQNPLLISHRGVPSEKKPHTFAGYDLAIEQGSMFVELDLVFSKDEYLMVSHDFRLDTILGAKDRGNMFFSEYTRDEIKSLCTEYSAEIHELEEVFQRYGDKINYVIETKDLSKSLVPERRFLKLISDYGLKDNIILESFIFDSLNFLRGNMPGIPCMMLIYETTDYTNYLSTYWITGLAMQADNLTKHDVEKMHKAGKKSYIFFGAKETEKELDRCLDLGIDGFFTDYTKSSLEKVKRIQERQS